MQNQNDAVLGECKAGVSVLVSKNYFHDKECYIPEFLQILL